MNILLAEDTEELNRAITQVLTMQGYEVDSVYDGKAATEYAASARYPVFTMHNQYSQVLSPAISAIPAPVTLIRSSGASSI